jgi:hypothetical protein
VAYSIYVPKNGTPKEKEKEDTVEVFGKQVKIKDLVKK